MQNFHACCHESDLIMLIYSLYNTLKCCRFLPTWYDCGPASSFMCISCHSLTARCMPCKTGEWNQRGNLIIAREEEDNSSSKQRPSLFQGATELNGFATFSTIALLLQELANVLMLGLIAYQSQPILCVTA